eukprot:1161293-Pelagomonas_calceolata.AAC.3
MYLLQAKQVRAAGLGRRGRSKGGCCVRMCTGSHVYRLQKHAARCERPSVKVTDCWPAMQQTNVLGCMASVARDGAR